jgi:hypothetical protein
MHALGGETALWHQRWKLMARVVRLGYNMMSVDTDFMFFQDPYVHFQKPPLSEVQVRSAEVPCVVKYAYDIPTCMCYEFCL